MEGTPGDVTPSSPAPDLPPGARQDKALHEAVPHPLGHALFRVMRAIMFDEPPLAELDALPLAQMRLLWPVFQTRGGTMKEFSERLGVSQSTVTQLADRLVKRGLIERQADAADRRVVRLQVSEQGRRILTEANRRQRETAEGVWSVLSPDEQQGVMDALKMLGEKAEAVRLAQGRPVSPFPEFGPPSHAEPMPERQSSGQAVVDLMSRRVRGNSRPG